MGPREPWRDPDDEKDGAFIFSSIIEFLTVTRCTHKGSVDHQGWQKPCLRRSAVEGGRRPEVVIAMSSSLCLDSDPRHKTAAASVGKLLIWGVREELLRLAERFVGGPEDQRVLEVVKRPSRGRR